MDDVSDFVVDLSWAEINAACQVAIKRQIDNESSGLEAAYGAPKGFIEGLCLHLRGCLGELATAKALNFYWTGIEGIRLPDVGGVVEVRTRDRHDRNLILHKKDDDDTIFVCAIVDNNPTKVSLKGWIHGRDGKKDRFYIDPAGGRRAYFVPNGELKDMNKIVSIRNRRVAERVDVEGKANG